VDLGGPWLIVGLGNPGPRYATTRHNAGALALDVLADRLRERWSLPKGRRAEVVESRLVGERVVLAKPTSYMNESGGPVSGLMTYYKASVERLIVVHDELDIDFGKLRLKRGGGAGGHNGLRSLDQSLGSKDYLRVRIGVGRPPGRQDPADYVLEPFGKSERDELGVVLEEAADACELLLTGTLEAAQNVVHPA
jgi:PTH1 family peptidyl-tRNA hydrolase